MDEGTELIIQDKFYSANAGEHKITIWRDLERTRKELLELSPEDASEINKFIDYTRLCENMAIPVAKPFDMMNLFDYIKLGKSMSGMVKVLKEYGGIDIEELADRFNHPLIKSALKDYMPKAYQAYAMLVSYAAVTSGNGDVPCGGSLAMSEQIVKKYKALGGKLYTNKNVEKVVIDGKSAVGIRLMDGTDIASDYVICACDTNFTFSQLLDYKYMPKDMQAAYEERGKYPVISGFQTAFAVDGIFEELSGTNKFECQPLTIGREQFERMCIRNYDYEKAFAPEGKCVIQCNFSQNEESFEYWKEISQNSSQNSNQNSREKYKQEKLYLAGQIMEQIIRKYPVLSGKIHILDVWTPVTYSRYCNSYHGAYMGFIITKNAKDQRTTGKLKGLTNVMIASQWQMGPGGLPVAAAMGKFSAQRVMKCEKMSIGVRD